MNTKEKFINKCLELTNFNIDDEKLKEILVDYIKNNYLVQANYHTYTYINAYQLLLLKLKSIRCEDLTWDFICDTTNNNFEREINILGLNMHTSIRVYISLAKSILEQIYIYLIKSPKYSLENINILKKYLYLFELPVLNNKTYDWENIHFVYYIKSKYPLNSNVKLVQQFTYKTRKGKKIYININFNTNNEFLINLLKDFIEYEKETYKYNEFAFKLPYLCFYYFFEDSLENNMICSLRDFNSKIFDIQYKFYDKKDLLLNEFYTNISLKMILKRLYCFINKQLKTMGIEYDIFYDSWLNTNLLHHSCFNELYEKGYVYIKHSRLEEYPKNDLWWLFANNEIDKSTSTGKTFGAKLDFTLFKNNIIKNQVKNYIWMGESMLISRIKNFVYIKEFFEFAYKYINIDSVNETKKINISFEVFWTYKIWVESNMSHGSIPKVYSAIRSFFQFNNQKYNISKKSFDILKVHKEEKHGTPIKVEDFKILEKEFRDISQNNRYKHGKLCYYIFMLMCTSNLRLGEILSLKRDCIVEKDNSGNGTVKALRKTSHGTYIKNGYQAHIIRFIELAKKETENLSYLADDELKNYIFLSKYRTEIILFGSQFKLIFLHIVKKNKDKLSQKYTAYNLRHTFINTVYDEVGNGRYTIDQAQTITGNNYNTVMEHYRRKLELKNYAEMMCGITISNVDIDGRITKNDKEIENKYIAMENLGVCTEDDCVGSTQCLACKHFVTTLSKIPEFEKKIQELQKESKYLSDEYRKKELLLEIKLLGAYLVNMFKLKKERE